MENKAAEKNQAKTEMRKRRVKMADGRRTLIYYTFEPKRNAAHDAAGGKHREETAR